jgi:hypothetical protein
VTIAVEIETVTAAGTRIMTAAIMIAVTGDN